MAEPKKRRSQGRHVRRAAEVAAAHADPVVIFGTGGSGTRVLQFLVERAGYFMGTNLNRPGDSLDVDQFARRWLRRYLRRSKWVEELQRGEAGPHFQYPSAMTFDFANTVEDHLQGMGDPAAAWGWKVPKTILMLPFVHEFFPGMRAIHLVRDGRDMAYSRNDNQVRFYSALVLEPSQRELPEPVRSILFWSNANLAAARYGERHIGGGYLRLRYEDVCADPSAAVITLLDFLGSDLSREAVQEAAAKEIKPSSTAGRWREREPAEISALEEAAGETLRAFGYA